MRKIIHELKIVDERNTVKRKLLRRNATPTEKKFWYWLRKVFPEYKWRRQHNLGDYIADFYLHEKKLVIEIDGEYHNGEDQVEYDSIRTRFFEEYGIRVIRFSNDEVLGALEEILCTLREYIENKRQKQKFSMEPSPSGRRCPKGG